MKEPGMGEGAASARDDLVFLKQLVTEGGQAQSALGAVLLVAGLIYGAHTLIFWAVEVRLIPPFPQNIWGIVFSAAPTIVFIAFLCWFIWRERKASQHGIATRAINAAFGGAGLASLTTATIFGYVAIRRGEIFLWLFHPITVFVVQGTVWYIAWAIRRRAWFAAVAFGWHAVAILMTVLHEAARTADLILTLAIGLFLLMALPGWVLWRSGART